MQIRVGDQEVSAEAGLIAQDVGFEGLQEGMKGNDLWRLRQAQLRHIDVMREITVVESVEGRRIPRIGVLEGLRDSKELAKMSEGSVVEIGLVAADSETMITIDLLV